MAQVRAGEGDVSVRLVWPFVRAGGIDGPTVALFARAGFDVDSFLAPAGRVPHRLAVDALRAYVTRTGDEAVGLRAGAAVEVDDLGLVGHAARCSATVRDALRLVSRFAPVIDGAARIALLDAGDESFFGVQIGDVEPRLATIDDFVLAAVHTLVAQWTGSAEPALEVHVVQPRPAYARAYDEAFGAPVRFNMPQAGILASTRWLERRMPRPRPDVLAIVERTLRVRIDAQAPAIRQRVAAIVTTQLPTGRLSMGSVAREMSMSVSTLGRRLNDEGARFGEIVDETRRGVADTLLRRPQRSVSEVAALVGFSHVSAFHSAFRRWTGMSPSDYRATLVRDARDDRRSGTAEDGV